LAGVGCAALADHLHATTWPSKFRPHLPEKYDGTSNPSEFLQVYVIAITAAGGDTIVMATYFHVDLSGCSIPKIQILKFSQTCSKFKMNFKISFQNVCLRVDISK
jgi:hypothetical protein